MWVSQPLSDGGGRSEAALEAPTLQCPDSRQMRRGTGDFQDILVLDKGQPNATAGYIRARWEAGSQAWAYHTS